MAGYEPGWRGFLLVRDEPPPEAIVNSYCGEEYEPAGRLSDADWAVLTDGVDRNSQEARKSYFGQIQ